MRNLLVPLGLVLLRADVSLQNVIAAQTISNTIGNYYAAPRPTEAPLRERADSVPVNYCGFFTGTNYCKFTLLGRIDIAHHGLLQLSF